MLHELEDSFGCPCGFLKVSPKPRERGDGPGPLQPFVPNGEDLCSKPLLLPFLPGESLDGKEPHEAQSNDVQQGGIAPEEGSIQEFTNHQGKGEPYGRSEEKEYAGYRQILPVGGNSGVRSLRKPSVCRGLKPIFAPVPLCLFDIGPLCSLRKGSPFQGAPTDARRVSSDGPIDLLHIRVFFGSLAHEADHVHAALPDGGCRQKVV